MKPEKAGSLLSSYVIFFIDNFGYALAFPLFPILFADPAHHFLSEHVGEWTRNFYITALIGAFPLAQFLGAPFFGELSDQLGRRATLSLTVTATFIGYLLTAFSLHYQFVSLLFFSRLLTGFFAGNMAICLAVISDVSSSKAERARHFSMAAAIIAVSWTSAFLFGSHFMEAYSFFTLPPQSTFWILAFLSSVSLGVVRFFMEETNAFIPETPHFSLRKAASHLFHSHKESHLFTNYSALFFWFFGTIVSLLWIPQLFVEKFLTIPSELSILFVSVGAVWLISSYAINRLLIGTLTLWQLTLWALFANSLFLFYTAAGDFFYYCAFSYAVCAFCGGIIWGNLFSFISLYGKDDQQGKVMGCAQACLSLVEVIGPPLGALIAGLSHELILYSSSLSVLIAFLLILTNLMRRKQKRLLED